MNKKRRYLISAAILAACVCIALGVLAMLPPRPGVTIANINRIEQGMSRAELASILGEPTGVLGNGTLDWQLADGTRLIIGIDRDKSGAMALNLSTETFPQKLRRWLHLPK
jgi:hypothetical protein